MPGAAIKNTCLIICRLLSVQFRLFTASIPGGHQNTRCKLKESRGAHQDDRWQPKCHVPTKRTAGSLPNVGALKNTCWVPSKMLGTTQNAGDPSEDTLGAHEDAECPTKCHMPTKRNAVCQHICQAATKKPCVHQIKAGSLSRCQVGTKRNAGCPPRCQVSIKRNAT